MALQDQILEDLKRAMKAQDTVAKDTLRSIKSELNRREMETGTPLTSADEIAVLSRAVKTRKESAAQYREGDRVDLAEQELAQIAVVERYLPKALDETEAKRVIIDMIATLGANSKSDMGKVMKQLREQYPGQIDGKTASKLVSDLLS